MALPFSPAALTRLEWTVLAAVIAFVVVGWFIGAHARNATTESERAGLVLGEYTE